MTAVVVVDCVGPGTMDNVGAESVVAVTSVVVVIWAAVVVGAVVVVVTAAVVGVTVVVVVSLGPGTMDIVRPESVVVVN